MKTKSFFLLPALIAVLNLLPAGRVIAQTFTTLHSFTGSGGARAQAGSILSGNTLYGTSAYGGSSANIGDSGYGTVFAVNTDGTGYTTLHNFTSANYDSGHFTNSDGAHPSAGLILSGNTLYGTASTGGSSGNGTVFAVNTDGTGFTNLHVFTAVPPYPGPYTNSDGAYPAAGLILLGNTLYGTAGEGGSSGNGTVFAVNTDGMGFATLHSFTGGTGSYPNITNSDGAYPQAGLILSGSTLYGTAALGGSSGHGTVFAVNTDGSGFATLHSFAAFAYNANTNSDGAGPSAGLILSGNTLYGTAGGGGSSGHGTVFAVNTDGSGFATLHSFTAFAHLPNINSDGAGPQAGSILSGNTLYGTASTGGTSGNGTVFAVNTDGTGFTNLHSFTRSDGVELNAGLILSGNTLYGTAVAGGNSGNNGTVFAVKTDGTGFTTLYSLNRSSDGAYPAAGLILSGNTLYGTADLGGSWDSGTVFSLSFRPQLTIAPSGENVILTWPANVAGFDYTGFTLQSTTNLVSPVVWSTNSPPPVIIGGQNVVTNPITGPQQFYWLIQ